MSDAGLSAGELLFQDGLDLYRRGFWREGGNQLDAAAHAVGLIEAGFTPEPWVLLAQQDWEVALPRFRKISQVFPHWWEPRLREAEALVGLRAPNEAQDILRQADELNAPRWLSVPLLADALIQSQKFDQALAVIAGGAELQAPLISALRERTEYWRAVAGHPRNAMKLRYLYWLFEMAQFAWEGEQFKLRFYADIFTAAFPTSRVGWRVNYRVNAAQPDTRLLSFHSGRWAARQLIRLIPDSPEGYLALADSHLWSCDFAHAAKVCLAGLKYRSNEAELWLALGNAHAGVNDLDAAADAYRRAIETTKRVVPSLNLAAVMIKQGLVQQAHELIGNLPPLDRESPFVTALECIVDGGRDVAACYALRNPWRAEEWNHLQGFDRLERVKQLRMRLQPARWRQTRMPAANGAEPRDCPVCGATYDNFKRVMINSYTGCDVAICRACGLTMTNPMPTPEALAEFYDPGYFQFDAERARWAADIRNRLLVNFNYYAQRFEWLEQLGLAEFEERCGPERSALDIGCSTGLMLTELARRGWRGTGIDLGASALEVVAAQGFATHLGSIESLPPPAARFHFAHAAHVIEHVPDPRSMLAAIRRAMVPGGWLLLITPCCHTPPADFAGLAWFDDPTHVYFFDLPALFPLIVQAHFRVKAIRAPLGTQFETSARRWRQERIGPTVGELLSAHGLGDVIWVLAEAV